MSKSTKIWLIVGACLVLVGSMIFGGVMMKLKWNFTKLSTAKYHTNNYTITESYKNISIVSDTADIVFIPCQEVETSVTCYEQKNLKHQVWVKDDTLVIEVVDTRRWYEHIGITFGSPKITVCLPKAQYGTLYVKEDTGDIEIPRDFVFKSIEISASTGNVANYASVLETAKIYTSTGNIIAQNMSAGELCLSTSTGKVTADSVTCNGNFDIKVSTGKTRLTNIRCSSLYTSGNTGSISLENVIAEEKFVIERSTGDVEFKSCDAKEIFATTSTGDIKGSLLSDKVFIAQTSTGRVDLPKTVNGGRCEIITSTGDIKIDVK